jgi:hypothetical protein
MRRPTYLLFHSTQKLTPSRAGHGGDRSPRLPGRHIIPNSTNNNEQSRKQGGASTLTPSDPSAAFQVQQDCGGGVSRTLQSRSLFFGFPGPCQHQLIPVYLALWVASVTSTMNTQSLICSMNTVKMFRHIWIIKIRFLLYKLTLFGKSRETRKNLESAWLDGLIPIGSGAKPLSFASRESDLTRSN